MTKISNTAYEALYQYLGLSLQERLRDIIVSEGFFKMVILIIFGSLFLITCAKYFTRHISSKKNLQRDFEKNPKSLYKSQKKKS